MTVREAIRLTDALGASPVLRGVRLAVLFRAALVAAGGGDCLQAPPPPPAQPI